MKNQLIFVGWPHLPIWKKGNSPSTASKSSLGVVNAPWSLKDEALGLVAESWGGSSCLAQPWPCSLRAQGLPPRPSQSKASPVPVAGSCCSSWVFEGGFFIFTSSCSTGPFPSSCWEHTGISDCARSNTLVHFLYNFLEDITASSFPWFSVLQYTWNATSLCTYAQTVIISPAWSDDFAHHF